nr:MAG TPA_asm: hypothetical protein [Caudoviricetes sp.]
MRFPCDLRHHLKFELNLNGLKSQTQIQFRHFLYLFFI